MAKRKPAKGRGKMHKPIKLWAPLTGNRFVWNMACRTRSFAEDYADGWPVIPIIIADARHYKVVRITELPKRRGGKG